MPDFQLGLHPGASGRAQQRGHLFDSRCKEAPRYFQRARMQSLLRSSKPSGYQMAENGQLVIFSAQSPYHHPEEHEILSKYYERSSDAPSWCSVFDTPGQSSSH